MTTQKILLGIVTRNRSGLVSKAISSALAQRGCALRVAVVDDGSTDKTSKLAKQFPMIDWTHRWPSQGYMAARNNWMASTDEDYFVSLDDDAWFLDGDEISVALEFLQSNPLVAAIAFDILSPERHTPSPRLAPRPAAAFVGCGHVLRLAAVRSVGVYEAFPGSYGGEEKDLCLRLLDAGYGVVILPGVHVWHERTSVGRNSVEQHRSSVCNDLVSTLRRAPAILLPAAFLVKCYQHFRFSWKQGLTLPCLEGFRLFLRSLRQSWRSRRPVKASTLRQFMRLSRQ